MNHKVNKPLQPDSCDLFGNGTRNHSRWNVKESEMRTKLSFLIVLAVLVGLMFNPGAAQAQSGASGTVVAWGNNFARESTVPAGLSSVTTIAAGSWHNLALKDGTVAAWDTILTVRAPCRPASMASSPSPPVEGTTLF
jgi:hypothetical protein